MRYALIVVVASCFLLVPGAAHATAQSASAAVLQFCQQNMSADQAAIALAKTKNPAPPTPPLADPPCYACGQTQNTQTVQNVNAWMAASENPEMTSIKTLLSIAHEDALMGSTIGELSAPAQQCWAQLDAADAETNAQTLAAHLWVGKAIGMAEANDTNSKMAYAGISFLLREARNYALIVGGSEGNSASDQAVQYAQTWTQSITSDIDSKITSGHQYNLCPVYIQLLRQVELLGGPSSNMDQVTSTLNKLDQLMKFKITMDLHAVGTPASGSDKMDMEWKGTANFSLTLDQSKGCYTPQIEGNQLAVEQQNWTLTGQNGDEVDFVSPSSFNAPIQRVTLTLCDPSPRLDIVFANYGPKEQAIAKSKGHTQGVELDMFGGMMTTAIVGDKALSGKYSAGTGEQAKSQLTSLKAEIQAHQGDTAWLMGPQGQAVIQQMQTVAANATGTGGQELGTGGITMPGALIYDVGVNWTNGTSTPVDQTIELKHTNGGTLDDELHVTVTQAQ